VVSIAVAIGLILLVIPGIYLAVKLSVAPVEAVVGKKGVVASLQSSWSKTEGNFLAILAVLVVVVIAIWIISVVLGGILLFAGLSPVGSFVSEFVGYSLTVSLVLIYQGISGPKAKKRRGR
jgi:membrane-anchored glycerophosphoryl diester phosphodiesterase (GDPDase)